MKIIEAKSILSSHNGMNLFRGCTHGCIYCDSRSDCYHTPKPFEDVEIKQNAPFLLEEALSKKRKKCMIGTGSMSDPYIQAEEKLKITRSCLEIIQWKGFGLAIQTKSAGILRDLDLLESINKNSKCVVQMTMTTFDENLCKLIEPNVSTTKERFQALKLFQSHGIPTVVWLCPLLPFINDTQENLNGILEYCRDAGVKGIICFGMGVTLRAGCREYFYEKLDAHFPGMKERYIRTYRDSYELASANSSELWKIFYEFCRINKIMCNNDQIFAYMNEFPGKKEQLELF